ncbi:NAD(P)H-dependent oxidoreductase [Cupriavidus basilensis]
MNTLLQLNSSLFSQHGQSTQLADQFVSAWLNKNPGTQVIVRDLSNDPVPHLDGSRFQSFLSPPRIPAPSNNTPSLRIRTASSRN